MLELGGLENHVTQLPYGDQLRDCRKILRSEVNHVNTKSFNKIQEAATLRLLRSLLESPEEFYDHIEWLVTVLPSSYFRYLDGHPM